MFLTFIWKEWQVKYQEKMFIVEILQDEIITSLFQRRVSQLIQEIDKVVIQKKIGKFKKKGFKGTPTYIST